MRKLTPILGGLIPIRLFQTVFIMQTIQGLVVLIALTIGITLLRLFGSLMLIMWGIVTKEIITYKRKV